jgi:GNAT superfamily N-acetyltransferase
MDARRLDELARLHVGCLPHSLVGALGVPYVRSFYRYVGDSDRELLVVERNETGRPVAAAVVSLEPATLTRRLLLHTPMVLHLLPALPRVAAAARATARASPAPAGGSRVPETEPQLILIFTAAAERGRGLATALLRDVERHLHARGISRYEARTEAHESNPALEFYRRRGFDEQGQSVRLGTRFAVFRRDIGAEGEPPLER